MNHSLIRYILSKVLIIEGSLMLLPIICSLIYHEPSGLAFLYVGLASVIVGVLCSLKKPKNTTMFFKEGCFTTAFSWIMLSIIGCLPFVISGEIPSFTDALFEIVSGITTTGASILNDIEALSHTCLLWRSFSNWIGGMGVLVFLLAIVPLNGGSRMNLMRAESPGPSVGKLVPKVKQTAEILYLIYIGLTISQFILLVIGKMPVFEAMCTSFGTAGTGGFAVKGDSMLSYSPYLQWVITIFMFLFGINFNAYFIIIFGKIKNLFNMEEVRWYFIIFFSAVAIICVDVCKYCGTFSDALRHSAFTVSSIMTTTGYSTINFNTWSETSKFILLALMFCGACAGSTGGGIKVSRCLILFKNFKKELLSFVHPKSIKKIKLDGKPVEHEVSRSTNIYLATFVIIFAASLFLLTLEGNDFLTNFSAVAATLNNIGPGLNRVGPTGNFAFFTPLSKYVLMIDMLAGRLELFPMMLVFSPFIWKDLFSSALKDKKIKS